MVSLKQNKCLRIILGWNKLFFWKFLIFHKSCFKSIPLLISFYAKKCYLWKSLSSFTSWCDFFFFRGYWFVLRVALYLLPASFLFTTIIGSLPHWRTDCTTWTKKEQAYRLRLEHFCDSHIYKCRSQAEKYAALKIFAAVFSFS